MQRLARIFSAFAVAVGIVAAPAIASAAPSYIDRPITLPRLVFAGDVGLGIGHSSFANQDLTGPGLNLEGAIGVTDSVELGLRTGVRITDDARAVQADGYGRTLWTETYGTFGSTVANPEFRVRWAVYSGRVAEVALDGRIYLPFEDRSRVGMMFGVPLAFHLGSIVRIDTGAYLPVVFTDPTVTTLSIPGYFWFQTSSRLWLGPMTAIRWTNRDRAVPGALGDDSRTDLLIGFGLGYQLASAVDLKTQIFFPRINGDEGAQNFGVGIGVQFRIND